MNAPGRIIGEFADYSGMLKALRSRVEELQIQGERFDSFAGLPDGYLSKLIGVRPVRRIGMTSLGPLLDALGIYCVVVEDPIATQRLKNRIIPRNNAYMRSTPRIVLTQRFFKKIGRRGAQMRWQRLTQAQRARIMRAVALKRWRG